MEENSAKTEQFVQALVELSSARLQAMLEKGRLEALLDTGPINEQRKVLEEAKLVVEEKDARVRMLARELFESNPGLKKEHGVDIYQRKVVKVLDHDGLREYCLQHMHDLLNLDESKVAAYVLNVNKPDPGLTRFLEIGSEPVVRIPAKLEKFLEE
jgi:hypothetical protein